MRELARRRPDMKMQVVMTCIAADYKLLWDELAPEPCFQLWDQARQPASYQSCNQHISSYYIEYLERREADRKRRDAELEKLRAEAEAEGLGDIFSAPSSYARTRAYYQCKAAARNLDKEPTTTMLIPRIASPLTSNNHYLAGRVYRHAFFDKADASAWDLFICSSEEVRQKARDKNGLLLYNDSDDDWSVVD
jgi:hypothetical protein